MTALRNIALLLLAALLGCTTVPTTNKAHDTSKSPPTQEKADTQSSRICTTLEAPAGNTMEYCKVCAEPDGKACRYMSRLIMGTDHINQPKWRRDTEGRSEVQARAVLYEAIRHGINTFDTAPIYIIDAENRVGTWLREFRDYVQSGTVSDKLRQWMVDAITPNPDDLDNDLEERKQVVEWLQKREAIKAYLFEHKSLKFGAAQEDATLLMHVITKGGFPFDLFHLGCFPTGNDHLLTPSDHSATIRQQADAAAGRPLLGCEKGQSGGYKWDKPSTDTEKRVPPGTYASRLFGDETQIAERLADEFGNSNLNLNGDIAVYLMHRDDGDYFGFQPLRSNEEKQLTPVATIMAGIQKAGIPLPGIPGEGPPRMIGWSNWKTSRVNDSITLQTQFFRPVMNSAYFSLLEMKDELPIHAGGVQSKHAEMMDPDFQKGILQSSYSPLGGFSILDQPGQSPAEKWHNAEAHARNKAEAGDPYWQNVYFSIFCNDKKPPVEDMFRRTKLYALKSQPVNKLDLFGSCKSPNRANWLRFERAAIYVTKMTPKQGVRYSLDQLMNAYALAHTRADFVTVGPITLGQVRNTAEGAIEMSRQLTASDLCHRRPESVSSSAA
jgi:aryl-alcohol dehydrogenase-like predicted oxidoreductase